MNQSLSLVTKLDGNDFTALGLALEVVAGYLLARNLMRRTKSFDTPRGFLETNPNQVRSSIESRYEARFGFAWLCLGLVVALAGVIRDTYFGKTALLKSSLYPVALAGVVVLVLIPFMAWLVDYLARRQYGPLILQQHKKAYDRVLWVLEEERERPRKDAGDAAVRLSWPPQLAAATQTLDTLADVFDESRKGGESDAELAKRLRRHFPLDS